MAYFLFQTTFRTWANWTCTESKKNEKWRIIVFPIFFPLILIKKKLSFISTPSQTPTPDRPQLFEGTVTHNYNHHLVLFPLSEIGPCVLGLSHNYRLLSNLEPKFTSLSLSTVLCHVSFSLPLLCLPSGVHVRAILVFSFTLFLSTCPISFQRLRYICCVISSIFVLNPIMDQMQCGISPEKRNVVVTQCFSQLALRDKP